MSELAITSADLRAATYQYRFVTPGGEGIWCPFTLNNMPSLPDPDTFILRRPGAGKTTAAKYQEAAAYAHKVVLADGLGDAPSVAEAVRTRLVDGSLDNDDYNFRGVDCSSFVGNTLRTAVEMQGGNLYEELRVPVDEVVAGYTRPNWSPNLDEKDAVLERTAAQGGLSVAEFTRTFHTAYYPERSVNIARLVANADPVEGTALQPGDLAVYTPTDPEVTTNHIAVVLNLVGNRRVKFAHSGRRDPRIERGGVEIFTLPVARVFDRTVQHGHRGTMAIHRLRFLQG